MELITSFWKVEGCVEAKEKLLYRFSAADQSTGGSDQSTEGHPRALCRFCAQDQSTDMPVSRLITQQRDDQSTDDWHQSTDRVAEATDRVLDGLQLLGNDLMAWAMDSISLPN